MKKYIILLPLTLLFFLSLIYPNRDYSYDSIEYTIEAQNHNLSFHPHHLLFYPTIKAFDFLFTSLHMQKIIPIMPLQFMNIVLFPVVVLLFYLMIINITGCPKVSFIISSIFAFSGGAWTLSVDNEVHTLPLLFLLLALYLFLSDSSPFFIAIVFSLSILYHQSYIFALPAFAYLIYSFSQEKKLFRTFLFSATSILLTAGFYLTAAIIDGRGSAGEIIKWILFYTESGKWGSVSFYNIFYSGAGLFQLFFSPRLMRLIVFGGEVKGVNLFYLILEIIGAFLIAVIFFILLKCTLKKKYLIDRWVRFSLIFMIPFSAFAFFWEPQNVEFWIPVFIPLLILMAKMSSLKRGELSKEALCTANIAIRKLPLLFTCLFLTMFIHNLFSAVIPASNIQNNETYLFAEKLSSYISDGDLLIDNKKRPLSYLKYFFKIRPDYTSFAEYPIKKWKSTDEIKKMISKQIDKHIEDNKKVVITSTEINPPEYDPSLTGLINAKERRYFYRRYEPLFKKNISIKGHKNKKLFIIYK